MATWAPSTPISLGGVGTIKDNKFQRVTSLSLKKIGFNTIQGPGDDEYTYESKGAVSIQLKTGAQAPTVGTGAAEIRGGIEIGFHKENAIVFHLFGCKHFLIDDIESLGNEIISRYKSRSWRKDLVVITEVITAERATILISEERGAKLDLNVNANVGTNGLNLANIGTDFIESTKSRLSMKHVARKNLTPLYKAHRIETAGFLKYFKKLFGKDTTDKFVVIAAIARDQDHAIPEISIKLVDLTKEKIEPNSKIIDPSDAEVLIFGEASYDDDEIKPKSKSKPNSKPKKRLRSKLNR